MNALYLLALGIALAGMVLLDRRFSLFFWACWWRAVIVLVVGVGFFLVWVLTGVRLGVYPGPTIETLVSLVVLCYLTMNVYCWLSRPKSASKPPDEVRG